MSKGGIIACAMKARAEQLEPPTLVSRRNDAVVSLACSRHVLRTLIRSAFHFVIDYIGQYDYMINTERLGLEENRQ